MTLLAAVEGYYGPPLPHAERLDLLRWLAAHGYDMFVHAPKSDPHHRERWREPYPPQAAAELAELVQTGRDAGVEVALVVSPGLDWRDGDEAALIAKLASFTALGATALGVAWDDVPPGGADLGARHGAAVAAAVGTITAARWFTCPTDYAFATPTPYLRGFVAALPRDVEVMWTGPSVVSPALRTEQARALAAEMGRPLLFAENFPVNDGPMSSVLHLGPYPARPSDLPSAVSGAVLNMMRLPRASRLGLAVAARWWRAPHTSRETAWRECLAEFSGLEPLARGCRSWAGDAGPDAELLAWWRAARDCGDTRLRDFLRRGCREGLDAALAAELEPWLAQWEDEAQAMLAALDLMALPRQRRVEQAGLVALLWARARCGVTQVFGIRHAYYPLTARDAGGALVPGPGALHTGENLTDMVCNAALSGA